MGELTKMINEDEMRGTVVLVFANKQDLPNAMTAAEITEKLGYITFGTGNGSSNQRVRRLVTASMKVSIGCLGRSLPKSENFFPCVFFFPRRQDCRFLVISDRPDDYLDE